MDLDLSSIAAMLPCESRYGLRQRRWLDGPHASWDAFDRVLGREIVVNVAYRLTDAARFIDDAKTRAHLRRPNILPVHDLGVTREALPFFTEPRIECVSLESLVRRTQGEEGNPASTPPLKPLVGAVRDACRAVDYARGRGYCHDDLDPGSILVGTEFREVFVLDGGKRQRDDAGESDGAGDRLSGMVLGRPAYMSREDLNAGSRFVPPARDAFRLGGILFLVLYGTPPNHLPGGNRPVDLIRAIAGGAFEPRQPGTLRTGVLPGGIRDRRSVRALERICLRALDGDPGRRHPGAGDLRRDLDEWLGSS